MNRYLLSQVREMLIRPYSSKQESDKANEIIAAIDTDLSNPQPEPVAETALSYVDWFIDPMSMPIGTEFYASPPKREPMSNERIYKIWSQLGAIEGGPVDFARAIEKYHGIGQ